MKAFWQGFKEPFGDMFSGFSCHRFWYVIGFISGAFVIFWIIMGLLWGIMTLVFG
jgi:hypothetical protein